MTTKDDSKVWFVTGASSGFGREIVLEALRRGDKVVAAVRKPEANADLGKSGKSEESDRVKLVRLDVTKAAEIEASVREAVAHFGRIDVLVNNAGYSIVGALEETSDAEAREAMETMFFGAMALTRAVLPSMRERRSGTIVQITSVGGLITSPGFGVYCAAKHALEAVSEALAGEVAPFGMKVLVVEPGAFRTALFGGGFRWMPENAAYAASVGPTRQFVKDAAGVQPGDPAKAAKAIVDAVGAGVPNFRLALGGDAIDNIRKKLATVGADLDATEKVARATTY